MSSARSPGEERGIPPEVPAEFAAAYRAAYEEAMRAQSAPGEVGRRARVADPGPEAPDGLPRRDRPIRIGTHRSEEVDTGPSTYERMLDSRWFVPALLLLLLMVFLLGAYLAGRQFSAHVGVSSQSAIVPNRGSD
jgi:hypothetical protein